MPQIGLRRFALSSEQAFGFGHDEPIRFANVKAINCRGHLSSSQSYRPSRGRTPQRGECHRHTDNHRVERQPIHLHRE